MAQQIKKSDLLTIQDAMISLYHGKKWYFLNGDISYESLIWEEDLDKPSVDILNDEILKLKIELDRYQYIDDRKIDYPSIEEWVEAYIQKEVDGQPEYWNHLVEKRQLVKIKHPK